MILTSFRTTFLAFSFFKSRLDIDSPAAIVPRTSPSPRTRRRIVRDRAHRRNRTPLSRPACPFRARGPWTRRSWARTSAHLLCAKDADHVVRRPFSRRPGVARATRPLRSQNHRVRLAEFARVRFLDASTNDAIGANSPDRDVAATHGTRAYTRRRVVSSPRARHGVTARRRRRIRRRLRLVVARSRRIRVETTGFGDVSRVQGCPEKTASGAVWTRLLRVVRRGVREEHGNVFAV